MPRPRSIAADFPPAEPDKDLLRLFDETLSMVDQAVRSFIEADAQLGKQVCEADAVVDQMAAEMLERISASMTTDHFTIERSRVF